MSLSDFLWIVALAGTAMFLIAKSRKEINRAKEKFWNALSPLIVFVFGVAILLGVIWIIVAIVHWAWRHS
jgi:hypothetical protein